MKSFKQYLFHRIKATWVLTAVLCLFAVIITATTVRAYRYTYWNTVYDEMGEPTKQEVQVETARVRNLSMIYFILCGLCAVVPVLELGGLKNKRNADTMYSLPIDRRKMGAAHFLNGFLQILAVYLCMAVTVSIPIIRVGYGFLHLQYLPPLMLLPIIASLLLYAYYSFLFNEANTTVDGCLFIASGTFMPFLLLVALRFYEVFIDGRYVATFFDKIDELSAFPFFPIAKIVDIFEGGLNDMNNGVIAYSYDELDIAMIAVWCVIGLLSALGFYLAFSRKRVEKIGDISSSWVGYKTIIPLCMFCITAAIGNSGDFFIVIIAAIAAVIGYMLYRRSFKIKAVDLVSIGGGAFVAIVLRIIEGFIKAGGGRV